ncbi:hypothetical protein K0T92_02275 [Paenibacillus oenotherae]|uniref:Uncharacterized protein n=1 Tax=Paenibacillus oenotherae TaxID=1435645 RepID=A0ABS7D0V9_9BACL|nr:YqhR family membrane protein [Paenibacillus oenotherae]MBW7473570.1 hypothetical protein [Paenibacillus oenotherae]
MHLTHKSLRQRKRGRQTNPYWFCVRLGFFAGLIWGSFRWVLYQIHFTKVIPAFLAEPFFRSAFLKSPWGYAIGLAAFILLSIVAALVYKLLLGKIAGPRPGIAYGLLWWVVLFIGIGPLLGMMAPIHKQGMDTIATELSVFLIWGLFIGFTIAYEFTDEATREPSGAQGAK